MMGMPDEQKLSFDCFKPLKFWTCWLYNLAYVDQYTFFSDEEIKIAWGSMDEPKEKVTGAPTVPSALTD